MLSPSRLLGKPSGRMPLMQKTLALVLKKQNIGETDRILTIFSPSLGKKRVIARAVRKPLSKLAGHLDTFMISQLMLTDEPDLPKVTSAQLSEPFEALRNSLELTSRAFNVSKLIERVILEDVSQRPLFFLTVETLSRITDQQNWPITWLYFLSQLIDRLGLGISQFTCSHCQQVLTTSAHWLIQERMFVCCRCPVPVGPTISLESNAIKLLQLLRRQPFDKLARISVPLTVAQQLEELYLREVADWLNKSWDTYSCLSGQSE